MVVMTSLGCPRLAPSRHRAVCAVPPRRDPNEPSERERRWPSYTAAGQSYARLNARPLAVAQGLRAQACAFWTRFLPKLLNVT
ncbi:hypothetical protein IHE44_0010937, partial [Lamprotornis superbus]